MESMLVTIPKFARSSATLLTCALTATALQACGGVKGSAVKLPPAAKSDIQLQRDKFCAAAPRYTSTPGAAIPLNSTALNNSAVAQLLVPGIAVQLTGVTVRLVGFEKDGNPVQSLLTVSIVGHDIPLNAPSSDALKQTIVLTQIAAGEASYTFKFDGTVNLTADSKYWLVIESSIPASNDRQISWAATSGNPDPASYAMYKNGTSWNRAGITDSDAIFTVDCKAEGQ